VDGVKGLIMTCDAIGTDDLRRCHVTPAADLVGPGAAAQHLEALVRRFAECPRVAVLPRGPYLIPEFDAP